jgi:hypothetical protein
MLPPVRCLLPLIHIEINISFAGAAFLEFHEVCFFACSFPSAHLTIYQSLAAFLDPANKDKEDTLVTSDEIYHNYVRCDVRFKEPARKQD